MNKVLFFAHLRDAVGEESIEMDGKRENRCGIQTTNF